VNNATIFAVWSPTGRPCPDSRELHQRKHRERGRRHRGANDTSGQYHRKCHYRKYFVGYGGGIEIDNAVALVLNNTIADNDGPGGGLGVYGAFSTQIGAMSVINNLIIGKSGQSAMGCRAFDTNNPPVFSFNDVFSPGSLSYGAICVDQTGQNGNISADPVFVNPVTSDFHLPATSPAIDAGSVCAYCDR
jgi:hypothetical protein